MKITLPRKRRYRVVPDRYSGHEVQKWRLWWPFWTQMNHNNKGCNTWRTLGEAITFIDLDKAKHLPKPKKRILWKD
jgi:hypothetical protein